MKIIHTSDWHLGQQFYTYDRTSEHEAFARWLVSLVEAERPDAFVLSGDVFDVGMPSVVAQKLYANILVSLHEACPTMTIVVTAGNHDSPSRVEIYRDVWQAFNVRIVGNLQRCEDGSVDWRRHIVEVPNKGYVVAIPHIYPQNYPAVDGGDRVSAFFGELNLQVAAINSQSLPVVLMAHTAVRGCDLTGHRRMQQDMIGNVEYIDIEKFGTGFSYVALGHIHCPQTLNGQTVARYSGSPIAVSFDEDYPHGVSVVTLESGKEPIVEPKVFDSPRPMMTLPREPQPFDDAVAELASLPADSPAYVRLNVLSAIGLPPDYSERIAMAVTGKKCRFCTVNITLPKQEKQSDYNTNLTPDQLRQLSPTDVAARFMEQQCVEHETVGQFLKMISEIEQEVQHED
ncbi:MAG: exonuclease SbcCD subunit D [Bacteroidales bacterium]|nr:exonuclease SbcCD subunit D [Bacteroidales bacterium]